MRDPYAILGVDKSASQAQIKAVWRQKAKKYHPDLFPEGPERLTAQRRMADINSAYQVLIARTALYSGADDGFVTSKQPDIMKMIKKLEDLELYSEAMKILKRISPRDATWYHTCSRLLMHMKRYDDALSAANEAIRRDPTNIIYSNMPFQIIAERKKNQSIGVKLINWFKKILRRNT